MLFADTDLIARTCHPCVMCLVLRDMSVMAGMSLPQMEASTQLLGMNSGASLTSAGAATRTP